MNDAIKKKRIPWNKGLTKETNAIVAFGGIKTGLKLLGRTNKRHSLKLIGRTKETHSGNKKQSEKMKGRTKDNHSGVARMAEKRKGQVPWNKGLTKETNKSICRIGKINSQKMKSNWKNPKYIETQSKVIGSKHYVRGCFKSYKNNCEIYFSSSFELSSYIRLEHDNSVKQYGRCLFSIPYIYEGKAHRYVPDIMIEYVSGEKEIIEVKPLSQLKLVKVILKHEALEHYCRENSIGCQFWTEKEIFSPRRK